MSDDVMKLLDSLDKPADTKSPRPSSDKRPVKDDEDIMGFLDSLTKSGKSTPVPSAKTVNNDEQEGKVPPVPPPSKATSTPISEVSKDAQIQPPVSPSADPLKSISSWWSKNRDGIWNTASSTIKQAEAKVRENMDERQASKTLESWSSLARQSLQTTISTVLETIAPPISRHEQLKIHIFHDMVGYSSIDMLVYSVFELVMNQVEGGGDLTMVVQKGKERNKLSSDSAVAKRELGLFNGSLEQAKKLAAANIEDYLRTSQETSKIEEAAAKKINDLDTFVSASNNSFAFIVYLSDPEHDINYTTVSQPFPLPWSEWLDTPAEVWSRLEVDPNEWVLGWVEDGLRLAVGIVAQSYVSKRMGVETFLNKEASAEASTEEKT